MAEAGLSESKDWVASQRSFAVAWALPVMAICTSIFAAPIPRTIIWIVALIWMGVACLANARRCGRTHCYATGPFFLAMTVPVLLHGFSIVPFGADGWKWLGFTLAVGAGGVWYLTEKAFGKFQGSQ